MFIVMDVDEGRILLSYKTRQIVISDLLGFAALFKKTILNFTEDYSAHQNWPRSKGLVIARRWAENEPVE